MKISKIKINSLYGIEQLELDGTPIELIGAKGTGKTSVIDSIRYALTNKSNRDYIIKQGKNEGEILIETDTGIVIDRKKRTDKADFTKVTEFGRNVNSPQSFLNDIFTSLQLNPVEFAIWDKNKQNRAILDLIEFEWDIEWIREQFGEIPRGINYQQHILQVLDDIQAKNSDYWLRREDCNRKELYKRQSVSEIAQKIPVNYDLHKWENYSLSDKINELQKLQKYNANIDKSVQYINNYNDKIRAIEVERDIFISNEKELINNEKSELNSKIARLKAEIQACEETLSTIDNRINDKIEIANAKYNEQLSKLDNESEIAKQYANKEKVDLTDLQREIETAEKMKTHISEFKLMQSMKNECDVLKQESDELTEKIKLARTLPAKVLETATIPVNGLTVENGIPLINGLPISNLSGGELIELCVDIVLSKPQNLQIILIDGAEALDEKSRNELYKKCKEKGLQIIATRTTNNSEFNIIEL